MNLKVVISIFGLLLITFSSCKTSQKANKSASSSSKKVLSEKEQTDFTYIYFNATKEKLFGNYDLAESLFMQCLRVDPSSAAAMYQLATIYSFRENKDKALILSKKAASLDPENTWYQLLYAECLLDKKQYNEIIPVYQKLIVKSPWKLEYYNELANAQIYSGKYNDAVKTYDKMEEIEGVNEDISFQKVRVYEKLGNQQKMQQELEKLIQTFPKEGKYYVMLGDFYRKNNQNDKAFKVYNELLSFDSEDPYVHLSLADYYRSIKEDDKSYSEVKLAFANSGLDIDTKIQILLSYFSMAEKYPEYKPQANELSKILADTHPEDLKAHAIYGEALYKDKKPEKAREQYRKAIKIDNSKYELWNQLLILDSELNDINAMQKEGKEAIELFPNQPVPYLLNGMANLQLKNYTEAVDVLNKGVDYVVDNQSMLGQFYSCLGDAYHRTKDYIASDKAYTKALEIDSQNVYVLNNYSYYLSLREEQLEKAEAMSKKSNEIEPNNDSYQDTYGWILYQMGKYEDAKKWIEKAMKNGGSENSVILEHYGDILNKLGDKEDAIKYWREAKEKGGGESETLDKKLAGAK